MANVDWWLLVEAMTFGGERPPKVNITGCKLGSRKPDTVISSDHIIIGTKLARKTMDLASL